MTPTAQLADCGAARRVVRRTRWHVHQWRAARAALPSGARSPGEARPDWQIFATLGRALAQLMPEPAMAAAEGRTKQPRCDSRRRRSCGASVGIPLDRRHQQRDRQDRGHLQRSEL